MLQIPFTTTEDLVETAKLRNRHHYEEERKKRIFNAKTRLFGIDVGALERQIIEKNKRKHFQAECEHRMETENQRRQHIIYAKQLDEELQRRIDDANINHYRCNYQRYEHRREFDLNDPMKLKNTPPMRIADDDVTLGVSSAQVFTGEDLGHSERKLRMRDQQRSWLEQQVREKREATESREQADQAMLLAIHSRDSKLQFMADSDERMRQELIDRHAAFNHKLAVLKRENEAIARTEKLEDDTAEIYNMMTSDMLSENPEVAQSRTNPKKKIAFMYRGMTPEELKVFREAQKRQAVIMKRRNTDKQLMEKQFERVALNVDRTLVLRDRELQREHQKYVDEQQVENFRLADLQRAQNEDRNTYRNRLSPDFFAQFNRNTR